MATVKDRSGPSRSRKRAFLYVGALFLCVLLALLVYNFPTIRGQMDIGTAYGARVACACHYIGGRDMEDCRKDFEPGMEVISLTVDEERRRVSASGLLIGSATAEFREGWGCVLLTEAQLDAE